MRLLLGDCLDKLKELDDNSIDSIVTDPPYGLSAAPNSGKSSKGGFMGKQWDYDVPSQEIWEECYRVLKPGGHLLSFAGSRTYHRMAVRIEDAGFEIRDQIMWIYGSGFPKSLNIGKSLESKLVNGSSRYSGNKMETDGDVDIPGSQWQEAADRTMADGEGAWSGKSVKVENPIAKEWKGWGTALKPAHEPIVMARKPLSKKTVVDNVLEWGTGGINIDDSRIPTTDNLGGGATNGSVLDIEGFDRPWMHDEDKMKEFGEKMKQKVEHAQTIGRFPANVIFDEEAGKILDEQSGISKSTGGRNGNKEGVGQNGIYGQYKGEVKDGNPGLGDIGGASRFFYCPKTSKTDRNEGLEDFEDKQSVRHIRQNAGRKDAGSMVSSEPRKNNHPTVKPTDLMLYLIRMVTPKGGTTLDPFMGSGSTGKAAIRGGFDFVGIEREKEYMEIATARIQYEIDNPYNEEKEERVEVNKNSQKFW
jgi:site-specific DNA-methyltransferase (adenine-specific)